MEFSIIFSNEGFPKGRCKKKNVHCHNLSPYVIFLDPEDRLFFEIQKPLPQSSEAWSNILRTSPIGILSFSLEERLRRQPQPLFDIQHI